jgi:hypothetical protein
MFRSFLFAGFEGSTGYNRHGQWFDQVALTGHAQTLEEDYRNLADLGLYAAREAIRWPLVDRGGGHYDFSSVEPFLEAAQRNGIEVLWDLFHFGFPSHVDLWSEDFPEQFAEYCHAAAQYVAQHTASRCIFTPINEPSFMAYAGGEEGLFAPHGKGRGFELKVALVRAAIAGIDAIRTVCPTARIVNVDPLCRVACPPDRPELAEEVCDFNERLVYQAWDMLAGRLYPELGGSRAHLDIVGINYYWTNQWEWGGVPSADNRFPPLDEDDPRRAKLRELVQSVWRRYGGEILITETAHIGDKRAPWLLEVVKESEALLCAGVPLRGVCWYPVLGMPEWHAREIWALMGLWDPSSDGEQPIRRTACNVMHETLASVRYLDDLRQALAETANQPKQKLVQLEEVRHRRTVGQMNRTGFSSHTFEFRRKR